MTPERYAEADLKGEVTEEEFAQGWHFCANLDDLLVGPGRDTRCCTEGCGWPWNPQAVTAAAEDAEEGPLVPWE